MDLKLEHMAVEKNGDVLIRQMLTEILTGLKTKLVQPVLEENNKIAGQLKDLREQEQTDIAILKENLAVLDNRVQQLPLVILAVLRDAINQAGEDNQNGD
ncbi:MAG: hypothetical protein A4E53_03941 [Pelotomaculum sp. PtaB.Bin104]|nr:MAG: hypothetical protein A4E53_03941 [Pelotomaculum sp. PtaB.Bin104]